MIKRTFSEIRKIFCKHNEANNITTQFGDTQPLYACAVASQSNFTKEYSEAERTYRFRSDNKNFIASQIGLSIYADSLEGEDNIRLDWYLSDWTWDTFYLEGEE